MGKILFFIFLVISGTALAQKIQYNYDNCGNRVQKLHCLSCREANHAATTPEQKKNEAVETKLGLQVYPNPAQDKMSVSINNLKETDQATLLLVDEQGKVLVNTKTNQTSNELDMTPYKPGIYFIKIAVGKDQLVYKVLKL